MSSVNAVVREWDRLVDEWAERCRASRGPIESAVVEGALSPDLFRTVLYLAHLAEQRGIDATDLLAFLNRPDLGNKLDAARVVVQRVGLAARRPESAVPGAPGGADAHENLMTLDEATKRVPGGRSYTTLWRWCVEGVNGVYLDHRRYGDTIYVSLEALEQFGKQLAEAGREKEGDSTAGAVQTSTRKTTRRARTAKQAGDGLARARQALEAAGIRESSGQ